jgi:nucleoside-diphosphate-sugar epimerase
VLVANFAAVHREPGHEDGEYYTTNLLGAATVCRWTATINCNNLIFTSSIAPYGLSENLRDESSIPVPASAYGGSKLAAEKIHEIWQAENRLERRLVIVRPGVVFGAGENGNVTRLIKATIGRYFLYMANRDTRKAGTYVKELCNAMYWVLTSKTGQSAVIFNMGMDPSPTIKDYVEVVSEVGSVKRFVPNIPYWFVYPVSFVIDFIAKLTGVNQPINPVRIRKLVRSNNIVPQYLRNNSYEYLYTFRDAMQDWKGDKPADWEQ